MHSKSMVSWPSLVLVSENVQQPFKNFSCRRKFPNPILDRSIIFACFDDAKKKLKLRHICKPNLTEKSYFRMRNRHREKEINNEECNYFFSLEQIEVAPNDCFVKEKLNILVSDIRDHRNGHKMISAKESGYWIRILGANTANYILHMSLYKRVYEIQTKESNQSVKCRQKKLTKANGTLDLNEVMKIGEISVSITTVNEISKCIKLRKNRSMKHPFKSKNIKPTNFVPTFCSREKYMQITTVLGECIENDNNDLFTEMIEKFSSDLTNNTPNDVELKLFLYCEKSKYLTMQGKFKEAKALLQEVTEKVIKSKNKIFLLNRAYICLANIHLAEGNIGIAEECLNVLQNDKRNGIPFEELIHFYVLQGVIMLDFSEKLPCLSLNLLHESSKWFLKSLKIFDALLPNSFHNFCRTHLYLARSYLRMHEKYGKLNNNNKLNNSWLNKAQLQLDAIENYGMQKLSNRLKCLYKLVKGEAEYLAGNLCIASQLIKEGFNLVETYNLPTEKNYYESLLKCYEFFQNSSY